MDILLVLPSLEVGGAEKVAITLINALSLQHRVTLFVLLQRGPLAKEISSRVTIRYGLTRGNTWWKKLIILTKLIVAARQHQVVVAGLEVTATYFSFVAALVARKPLIAWIHTLLNEYFSLRYFSAKHRPICRWLYRRIRHQVFVSHAAKASMVSLIGQTQHAMQVIYNPVIPGVSTALPDLPAKRFILAVGRLASEKGFAFLIDVFAKVRQQEDVVLLILGEGPERAALTAQIEQLGLLGSVLMPGFVANAYAYYRHASVFTLTSSIEGLPTVLIEAMQSGVPIVATDLPAVRELVDDTVKLADYGDNTAFAAQIIAALQYPEEDSQKQARLAKASCFTVENIVPQWEAVLHQAVQTP